MRCGRSWGLSSEGAGGRAKAGEVAGGVLREGQTFGGESLLIRYVNFVKLPHTIFALPFALLGLLVASREVAVTWRTLGLALLAFTCARVVALGFHPISDREFYALQDEAFDRAERLASLVVRFGQARAILVAKLLHGLALAALVLFGLGAHLGVGYYGGVAVGAALIAWEHRLVKPGDLSRLDAAFFTANGIVSIVVCLGALVDRVL